MNRRDTNYQIASQRIGVPALLLRPAAGIVTLAAATLLLECTLLSLAALPSSGGARCTGRAVPVATGVDVGVGDAGPAQPTA